MQGLGAIPAFCLPKKGAGPPQNLQSSKQRKGLHQNGFENLLQEYTCERNVKPDFSMDIAGNLDVTRFKVHQAPRGQTAH